MTGTAPFSIQIAGSALAISREALFSRHSCYSAVEQMKAFIGYNMEGNRAWGLSLSFITLYAT